jgi:hypothetical protein
MSRLDKDRKDELDPILIPWENSENETSQESEEESDEVEF